MYYAALIIKYLESINYEMCLSKHIFPCVQAQNTRKFCFCVACPNNNSRNSFHNELLKGNSDRRYVCGLCKCIMTNSRTPFVHLSGRGHRFFSSRCKKKKVQVAFLFEPSFRCSIVNTMESKVIIYDAIKISN